MWRGEGSSGSGSLASRAELIALRHTRRSTGTQMATSANSAMNGFIPYGFTPSVPARARTTTSAK